MSQSDNAGANWTPEQFWEYADGLLGTHVCEQMRDRLTANGLIVAAQVRIDELEGALQPFAKTGWMTGEIEHTDRTIVAHMHPEREREIILSSDDFKRARDLLQPKGAA